MTGSGGATVLDDLPESVVVQEILVRLPPKDLLRCRAVRKCWHSATSADKFMLDHRRRQPLLPILQAFRNAPDQRDALLFVSRDAGAGDGQQELRPFLRSSSLSRFHAALDGLVIVFEGVEYFICNPVTRKCAPLRMPQIHGHFHHRAAGYYRHQPSGEYRALWVASTTSDQADTNYATSYYVVELGSDNPRCVRQGCTPHRTVSDSLEVVLRSGLPCSSAIPPVHHHGSLHWKLGSCIMVFNTTAEIFRLMCSPAQLRAQEVLLEMDGALAFCSISTKRDTVDVWVMQDYDAEIWSFKHRIDLSMVDPPSHFDPLMRMFPRMAVLNEGELLIQFNLRPVLRYDIHGKFLGYVKSEEARKIYLRITRYYLQESVIPLPLFQGMREVDEPPFFVGL